MAQLTADYRSDGDDEFPLLHDTTHTLDFTTTAGHRYLVIGLMEADASNGGRVAFDNSFRLTAVGAPVGALSSSALGAIWRRASSNRCPSRPPPCCWSVALPGLVALRRRTATG